MNFNHVEVDHPGRVPVVSGRPRVRVFDTTLRDGEQTPGIQFTTDDKVTIASMLDGIGVDTIEAGFPASSSAEHDAVRAVATCVEQAETAALARCMSEDIEAAASALTSARAPVIHLVYGASDVHLQKKFGVTRAEALRCVHRSVSFARTLCDVVQFSLEDATRSERVFMRQMIATAIAAGATRINIPDTIGCATPGEYASIICDAVQAAGDDVIVSAHCHNDLGMATANTAAAVGAGARQVEVTVNGIGERAGNAAMEEFVVAAHVKGFAETCVAMQHLKKVSAEVARRTDVIVQPNKAVVGDHAFAHSSGIHQAAIVKDAANYECIDPSIVGVDGHRFVLTARSGRAAVAHELKARGYVVDRGQVDRVYATFMKSAREKPGPAASEIFDRVVGEMLADAVN